MLLRAAALTIAALMASGSTAASPSTAPWFNCGAHQLGPALHFCRTAHTLQNAWYVFKPYGSFHLSEGRYVRRGSTLRIELLNQAGLIAIENARAIVLTTFHVNGAPSLYASLMTRTAGGFFSNTATVLIGRRVKPRTITLRGNRLRISIVLNNGREATQIYRVTDRSLIPTATRHAQ